jgi:hypothetical protein
VGFTVRILVVLLLTVAVARLGGSGFEERKKEMEAKCSGAAMILVVGL